MTATTGIQKAIVGLFVNMIALYIYINAILYLFLKAPTKDCLLLLLKVDAVLVNIMRSQICWVAKHSKRWCSLKITEPEVFADRCMFAYKTFKVWSYSQSLNC